MNDFEAHEGSYDHQHRKVHHLRPPPVDCMLIYQQRLKEMRQLTKDPAAIAKARAAEQQSGDLKSVDISKGTSTSASGPQKKKPVFKSTLQPHNAAALGTEVKPLSLGGLLGGGEDDDPSGAVRNGWYEDRYQPRFVTGCEDPRCTVCVNGRIDLGEVDVGMGGT